MTADLSVSPRLIAPSRTPRTTVRHSPLEEWRDRLAALAPAIDVVERPFLSQLTVRVDPAEAGKLTAVLGVDLPTSGTAVRGMSACGSLDILWMGPDEFLVIGPPDCQEELEYLLNEALYDVRVEGRAAVVDVSAQRTTLDLSGPFARDVLSHGCSADLHVRSVYVGTCSQTLLARTGIVLIVRDPAAGEYTLLVRASFATYLAAWLVDASTEYVGAH